MNGFQEVPLLNVLHSLESGARPKGGATIDSGEVPSIGGEHITDDGKFKFKKIKLIPQDFYESMRSGKVGHSDILIVKDGATTGRTCIVGKDFPFKEAAVNEHVFCLKVNPEMAFPPFVCHFLRTSEGQKRLMLDFRGATVGGISRGFVNLTRIPLPELNEQMRIAHILDNADMLRSLNIEAIEKINLLIKSVFLHMFGDPVLNPKGWNRIPFKNLLKKIDSGWSPVCEERSATNGEWGVLKLGALTSCEYRAIENKALPATLEPDPSIEVKAGDILFTRKNTYELVAACVLVRETPPNLMMSDLMFRFVLNPNSGIMPIYLQQLLTNQTKRTEIQKLAGGTSGSMPNISKGKLEEALIEVPPLPIQIQFSNRVESLLAIREKFIEAKNESDRLFESIRGRAFIGRL